tara:strand:- start:1389 stop:2468 length:1080 start_codon:yes stop_codon:yes gene_type:complete
MNFLDDPSEYFINQYPSLKERYENGVYKELSNTSCYTSILTAGLWRLFGDHTNFEESFKIFEELLKNGINHFDLGNNYGRPPGSAEKKFGIALKSFKNLRDEILISSKAGYEMLPGPNGSGSSLKHLRSQIEGSLKRLDISYLDIFYTHRYDSDCILEVLADNLKYLFDQKLFLYVGISSYPKKKLFELIKLLNDRKIPIACLQYNISILSLNNFKMCKECFDRWGIRTIAFSPLNQGIITDDYFVDTKPNNSRAREKDSTIHKSNSLINEGLLEINKIAKKNSLKIEDLAISSLLTNEFICSAAYGPRNKSQVIKLNNLEKQIKEIKNKINFDYFMKYSVSTLDQWQTKNLRSKYKII